MKLTAPESELDFRQKLGGRLRQIGTDRWLTPATGTKTPYFALVVLDEDHSKPPSPAPRLKAPRMFGAFPF